ncbi:hypothetical protein [Mucilaginibacter psychrotolerans]|uniref:Four helix bundle protein n=1 Tax=Mucilaginibacter psychrotolerans TaxID=1524096 RepID=A0A4Y8S6F6_9SPHI|nr:hypothetical protein [Mucilaginibacter psychrotolerans]TFF34195.1 hypothetical protein E2R66_22690 [Mucilaginibacter psychrotolerans]
MSKRFDKILNLPVYKKADEIYELAQVIVEVIGESDKREAEFYRTEILSNATLILGKIAGASGGTLYSLKMYNAVRIRLAIQDMMNAVICTEMFGMNEEDYVQLMRDKVEEFRITFVQWIRGFDKTNDLPDDWGIRFDTSTPEQEKLEELLFDEDKFFDGLSEDDDDDLGWTNDDENHNK